MNRRLSRRTVLSGVAASAALGMTGCLQNPDPSGGGGGGPVERYTPGDAPGSGTVTILGAFGGQEQDAFLDNVIMYEVLSELRDIAARPDGITCACGSKAYGMTVRRSAVDLDCKACGAKLRISAATDRDLDDLCCHMKLVIPGK